MSRKAKKTGKYRSKFESEFAKELDKAKVEFRYEKDKFKYTIEHTYNVDFAIPGKDGYMLPDGFYVETKGRFTSSDRAKMLAVKQQHPLMDIRLVFMQDNYLYKGSKTRYSDWCKKHGFKYHIARNGFKVPKEWLKELK